MLRSATNLVAASDRSEAWVKSKLATKGLKGAIFVRYSLNSGC